jgi:putative transposase
VKRSQEQIISVLKDPEVGAKTADLDRRHGVSEATPNDWKAKFGSLYVSEAKPLRALEDENGRLLADAKLGNAGLNNLLSKKWKRPLQSGKRSSIFKHCLMSPSGGRAGFILADRTVSR